MGSPEVTFPITQLLIKEVTLKGSFRYGVRGPSPMLEACFDIVPSLVTMPLPLHSSPKERLILNH